MEPERQARGAVPLHPDRKGERRREHLKTFAGFLQADAYAGFERLYDPKRTEGVIAPVACWAHVRRKLYDVFKADNTAAAALAVEKIKELYEIERAIDAEPPDVRLRARKLSKLKILAFFVWADDIICIPTFVLWSRCQYVKLEK